MSGRRKITLASGLVMMFMVLLSVPVSAECPNGCSGNGACMAKDMCNCYKNYQGNDCLDRTCQYDYAHADTPKGDIDMDQVRTTGGWLLTDSQQHPAGTYEYFNPDAATNEAHFYMECANKGLCDRTLGVCTCFDGYEGAACQRAICPNKCSGHGTCESLRELGLKTPGTLFGYPDNADQISYDLWDSRVTYGCRCDPWYHGADCSLRSCKVGVDPMFLAVGSATFKTFALHVYTTGTFAADTAGVPPLNFVRLRLFDYHGEAYITDAIPIGDDTAGTAAAIIATKIANVAAVSAAIKKVPNQTFRNVLCEELAQTNGDLDGYLTTRLASSGLSVVCQFTQNPGRLRTPEVASFGFKGIVDPLTKDYKVYTLEDGIDYEWFTENTKITYVSIAGAVITVTNADAVAVEANPTLFRIGSRVVVGKLSSLTELTLTYPTKHTLSTTSTRFNVPSASGMVVTELISTAVAVGATSIDVTTNPAFTPGQLIFFENQFYKPQAVTGLGPYTIRLDRAFPGNSANGAANTILKVYVVTPPKDAFKYRYVSECSGRGLCTTETGVCACFRGYTNDNCDTQNILAL